jgi:hypothetical protein
MVVVVGKPHHGQKQSIFYSQERNEFLFTSVRLFAYVSMLSHENRLENLCLQKVLRKIHYFILWPRKKNICLQIFAKALFTRDILAHNIAIKR